jgi:hemoglobin-like flavoprotein
MTPTQMQLVTASWSKITPFTHSTTARFYEKLFSFNPALQQQFLAVSPEQKGKIIALLGLALASSDRIENIVASLQEMKRRHVDYALTEHDYQSVSSALMWTLTQCLEQEFSHELRTAWSQRLASISAAMKQELSEEVTYGFTD